MTDNPYPTRAAVVARFGRACLAPPRAGTAEQPAPWLDRLRDRGACFAEPARRWVAAYFATAGLGLAASAALFALGHSLVGAAAAVAAAGGAFGWLWLRPPRLLVADVHGLWVVRQIDSAHVPWAVLRAVAHDAADDAVRLVFKAGTHPEDTTRFIGTRWHRSRSALGLGFAVVARPRPPERRAVWTLTVQPAGVPSRELAALLHGALTHFGKPAVEPATARPSEPRGNEREFDLPV